MKRTQLKMFVVGMLFAFLIVASPSAFATKKVVRSIDYENSNGSFGHYRYETTTHVYILCWADESCGTCPQSVAFGGGGSSGFDATDLLAQKQLFADADAEVEQNTLTGTATRTYQVAGESTTRTYQVVWLETSPDNIQMTWSRIN